MTKTEHVARVLCAERLPRTPELALQNAIARTLRAHGLTFEREVRLSDGDQIDFLVGDDLGLEVKIDGSLSEVTRQIHRYAQSKRIAELLLVTTRSRHRPMPPAFSCKPIHVLHLLGGAF